MRTKNLLALIALLLAGFCSTAQTQFWSDNFEDAGSPSAGSRTLSVAEISCTSPSVGYFKRSTGTETNAGFTSFSGSKFFAAMNIDVGPTCTNTSSPAGQTITWSGINISGKTGLSFKGLFGANSAGTPAVFQGLPFAATGGQDSLVIQYRIGAGAWVKLIGLYADLSSGGNAGTLRLDTDGNYIGDGTAMVSPLTELVANISGTGSTLDLRFCIFNNNSSPGSMAIDNFRLFESAACNMTANITSQTNVACNGGSTGAATVAATNGTGALTYSWTPGNPTGDSTASISGLAAGNYTVIITDANNCTATKTVSITQPTAITSNITSQTNIACNGGSTGAVTVTASGGTGSYTYDWTPGTPTGDGTNSISGLSANTYTVTITDANSCVKTQAATITQPTAITSNITSQTNIACNGGSTGAVTVTAGGGAGSYTYDWTPGTPTGDGTNSISGLSANTYTVTITDANSCVKTQAATITQPTAITSNITSQTNIACNGGSTGAVTVTAGGGAGSYTYDWTPGTPTGDGTNSISGLSANTYTVTITDANSCVKTQAATITQPTAITSNITSQTNIACNGGSTGAVTVTAGGGAGSYTYDWTPGTPTGDGTNSISGLSANTYTVTITDANSCVKTQAATITQPTAITSNITSQTNIACNGGSTGAVTVTAGGGAGSYTYDWTPGTPTGDGTNSISGLSANTYTVTITDANSCVKTQAATITQPTAITSNITSQTNIACNGGSTGAVTVTAGGGAGSYTYDWTPGTPTGDGTNSISGLSANTYTVTITDANSCVKTQAATITQPTAITSNITSQTNIACNGGSTGAVTVTAGGGAGSYTYDWTPGTPTGDGTNSISGLSANTYTVTITDANSCVKTQAATITQPTAITSNITSQTNIACNGGSTGAVTVTAGGGAGSYTYDWTPGTPTGDGTNSISGLSANTYTVTITDANSCVKTQAATITQPTAITSNITSQTNIACNGGSTGAVTVTAGGGAGSYTYDWTPGTPTGDGTNSISGLSANTYTVTITDANSCVKTQAATITQPTAITSNITSQTNIACNGGSTGAVTVTAGGGAGSYTYDWTPGTPTGDGTNSISGLSANTYTVTITDANSCVKTQAATITQPTVLNLTVSNDTNICVPGTINITATASGGAGSYTYTWTPGNLTGATQPVSPTTTTSYVVTASDANACTKKDTVIVSVGGVLAQSNQTNTVSIDGADTSSSNVVISGFTYLYNDECKTVASVRQNAALGTITGYVTVVDSVPVYQNRPFAPRWYQITPQNNGAGSVNLYFTQQDFNDYNVYAALHSFPRLPQNPTDQVGIDSLVVTKVSGGSLMAGTGTRTLVHPDSVKWNPTLHFWTVSLTVPTFSEFYVHTNNTLGTPLYVNISSFNARKENGATGLYWTTATEIDNAAFDIQRSMDGKTYQTIGSVASKAINGNSRTALSYSYYDKTPFMGMNFYRLAEKDKKGNIVYSDVRTLNFDGKSDFNCYPNPVKSQLTVEYNSAKQEVMTIRVTDVMGKVVLTQEMNLQEGFNKTVIDMSVLGQGIYNMNIISNSGMVYTSKVIRN